MSTKRISQEIANVEVKFAKERRITQEIANVEVKLPKSRYVTQLILNVEVGTTTRRLQAPAAQWV